MTEIKKIRKSDIPELLNDNSFWNNSFLAISRHRLYSHFQNPTAADDDIILLLAFTDKELVGYMGAYIDHIYIGNELQKIAWLSTWWVDPKTKGSGVGRLILDTMYKVQNGKIGISQFTASAKRVYDKSAYFNRLKLNHGIKAVLRSNLSFVLPALYPKLSGLQSLWKLIDSVANFFINIKISLQRIILNQKLQGLHLEYLAFPDSDSEAIIRNFSSHHIARKSTEFFKWLKASNWVLEAPLEKFVQKQRYEFSMYDRIFDIYYIKVTFDGRPRGFIALQRRGFVCKVLYAYYEPQYVGVIANIIKLQCATQDVREIITYDAGLVAEFRKSAFFLYQTKKTKESIISKQFGDVSFEDRYMNFGDGDCSFA